MKYSIYILLSIIGIGLTACNGKKNPENIISVTIEPQRYFAEQIAGNKFSIQTVVPAGQSPETYDPTPQQMIQIGKSIAYLQIGSIGFEQTWMPSICENNPKMQLFNLSEGISLIQNTEEHENENHDHHHHGETDPHTWSSVSGAKAIAWNTLNAFIALDRENTAYYWANYKKLLEIIEQTEANIQKILSANNNKAFIIYHPALSYFAKEFNLEQLCIEMDGKEPSPAQLKELVETARKHNAKVVFIQQEFDQKNAEIIAAETGCKLIKIKPLNYNWPQEMIHIAKALANE